MRRIWFLKGILFHITLFLLFLNQECRGQLEDSNLFSSAMDTLVIRTKKQKGNGLFTKGAAALDFKDTLENFAYPIVYPKNIRNIKRTQRPTVFKTEKMYFVDIMKGTSDGNEIYILDANSNKNFSDDSVRVSQKMNWFSSENVIQLNFLRTNGSKNEADSSWVDIGTVDNRLYYSISEHLVADFDVGKKKFKVGIVDLRAGDFTYGVNPEIALLHDNTAKKDTLPKKDILKIGEILNLDGNYYRFESVSTNGKFITLIKEKRFSDKIGTQVGMIAPDFMAISTKGDTINSNLLHDRTIVIANTCACGGDKISYEAYSEIRKKYGDKIHVIGLDSGIKKNFGGLLIDMEDEFNKGIYLKYRNAYCSRTCYVIDRRNKVIDKFEIYDWKSNLPKQIN